MHLGGKVSLRKHLLAVFSNDLVSTPDLPKRMRQLTGLDLTCEPTEKQKCWSGS